MLAGLYRGPGRDAVAWDLALLYDMIFDQPVVYDLVRLKPPVLLMSATRTRPPSASNSPRAKCARPIGHYPELAKSAGRTIPNATVVEFPGSAMRHKFRIRISSMTL